MARITGLATGLDVDTIIKQTMQAYRSKIDLQQQKKDILEIKQKLYRDVITDAQDIYNKHFDVLKSGSLVSSKTWQSVEFKSDSNSLTVTADSSAKVGNYTVTGNIAKASNIQFTEGDLTTKGYLKKNDGILNLNININGTDFTVSGANNKELAKNLNTKLSDSEIGVKVRYTDFANTDKEGSNLSAFIFESNNLGKNNNFTIGEGGKITKKSEIGSEIEGAKTTGLTVNILKDGVVGIDGSKTVTFSRKEIFIDKEVNNEITIDIAGESSKESIKSLINAQLAKNNYSYICDIDENENITFISTITGNKQSEAKIEIKNEDGTFKAIDNTKFIKEKEATQANMKLDSNYLNKKMVINGVEVDLSSLANTAITEEKLDYINKALEDVGITASADDGGNIKLTSKSYGSEAKIDLIVIENGNISTGGEDSTISIKDSNGGIYKVTEGKNSIIVDGITFNFTGEIPEGGISVTSKIDASEIVDKVKSYIEDYNALIVKINTLTTEKRDRSYQPLTADQKKEMSETEIKFWGNKVKQGQLKGDSDLNRIANSLKQGMKSLVSGTGLTLSDIGIESVQDYGGIKDGTFKINEDTLKKAIEDDTEGVMKLFMQSPPSDASENDKYNQSGIMNRLKDILYKETVTSKASLLQKAGFEGTTTVANNTITKSMEAYTKKISEMESLFSTKEQTLYSKYAKLETLMNNYNSQMSYLSQTLGLSTS